MFPNMAGVSFPPGKVDFRSVSASPQCSAALCYPFNRSLLESEIQFSIVLPLEVDTFLGVPLRVTKVYSTNYVYASSITTPKPRFCNRYDEITLAFLRFLTSKINPRINLLGQIRLPGCALYICMYRANIPPTVKTVFSRNIVSNLFLNNYP